MSKEDDVGIRGDLTVLGSFIANAIETNTLVVNVLATIDDLDVTANIDAGSLSVVGNISTATLTTTGLATLNSLSVTTTITTTDLFVDTINVTLSINSPSITVTNMSVTNNLFVLNNANILGDLTAGSITLPSGDTITDYKEISGSVVLTGSLVNSNTTLNYTMTIVGNLVHFQYFPTASLDVTGLGPSTAFTSTAIAFFPANEVRFAIEYNSLGVDMGLCVLQTNGLMQFFPASLSVWTSDVFLYGASVTFNL